MISIRGGNNEAYIKYVKTYCHLAAKHLILFMQWCIAVVICRRQLTDVLRDINILHLGLTAATYELDECIMHEAVLILHAEQHQGCLKLLLFSTNILAPIYFFDDSWRGVCT